MDAFVNFELHPLKVVHMQYDTLIIEETSFTLASEYDHAVFVYCCTVILASICSFSVGFKERHLFLVRIELEKLIVTLS